jgi:hypothetical protein
MEDDDHLDPLDVLHAYGVAGSFTETRLARLKLTSASPEEIEQCEGMSGVLFRGMVFAASCMTDEIHIIPDPNESETRMLS